MGRKIEEMHVFWEPRPLEGEESESASAQEESPAAETQKAVDFIHELLESAQETAESVQETTEAVQETAEAGEDAGISSWVWFAGAGVLVLLAAFILFLVFRKKKDPGENQAEEVFSPVRNQPMVYSGQDAFAAPVSVVSVGNIHHIGDREEQQDGFAISDFTDPVLNSEKGCLAIVADGMGGLRDGGKISAIVTASMLRRFEQGGFSGEDGIPMELLQSVQGANEEVLRYLGANTGQSGSTVVAVWVYRSVLHYISVGDSRICLIRNGTMTVLNREHVYGSELDERAARGEISLETARTDPQRDALTSFIGSAPLKKIDRSLHGFPLLSGDKILLMSDGVFGTLSDGEILMAAGNEASVMAGELQRLVLSHRKPEQDNFTAVVLQCG